MEITSKDLQAPRQIDTTGNKFLLNYQGFDIHQNDVKCLAGRKWLNDNIIGFWLSYTEQELMTSVDRDRTYIFSSQFYEKLTSGPETVNNDAKAEDDTSSTPAQRRYDRVKKWTKRVGVDIFEKDFLIIPINESQHWFLAVICFPGLIGVHDIETGELIRNYQKPAKKRFVNTKSDDKTEPISNANANDIPDGVPSTIEGIPDQDITGKPKLRKVKQSCILIFDSVIQLCPLAGEVRNRVYSTLREYLKMEYKTQTGKDRDFTKNSMPGIMPKVPQQLNFDDCGIYMLSYVEFLFKYPIKSFDILSLSDDGKLWDTRICRVKRERMHKTITELIETKNPEAVKLIPLYY